MPKNELIFNLTVEDGWPPVAAECLVCTQLASGYRIEVPPFFVGDLSVGDIISVDQDDFGVVISWTPVMRSRRSTLWLKLAIGCRADDVVARLMGLGCNIEELQQFGYFSIDVPESVSIAEIDGILESIMSQNAAIAYPSLRHE